MRPMNDFMRDTRANFDETVEQNLHRLTRDLSETISNVMDENGWTL